MKSSFINIQRIWIFIQIIWNWVWECIIRPLVHVLLPNHQVEKIRPSPWPPQAWGRALSPIPSWFINIQRIWIFIQIIWNCVCVYITRPLGRVVWPNHQGETIRPSTWPPRAWGDALSPRQSRCCSRGYGTHQERDFCPRVSHTKGPWRRKLHFKPLPTNGSGWSIIHYQHQQQRHVEGKLWRKRQRFDLFRVAQKFPRNLKYHSISIVNNWRSRKNPQGLWKKDLPISTH